MTDARTLVNDFLTKNNINILLNSNIRELKDGGILVDRPTVDFEYKKEEAK